MNIRINGENREIPHVETLAELLATLGIDTGSTGLAVARNADVIARSRLAETPVEDGDRIEIVHAVQGG
ncbi:MAG: sulfur carrier protein ThiS [Candidatus Eisenbacteria bacterium]